jgi:EmrB/QacA subfamily drug resistance transporter
MDELHHSKRGRNYKWKVLIVTMIGTFMAVLDSSIVNVSLPAIKANFGCSTTDIEWILTGYMLSFAALMPLTAWLRERIGYKILFLSALGLFTVGSLLCGMAWNLPTLITARVIQALGGGAISPTAMAMLTEVFGREERGKALSYWGLGTILGPAIGPTLGGYLTHTLGWRSIFLVNLPVGIVCIFIGIRMLAEDRPTHNNHRNFDMWGFAFLTIFLVSFLLGLSKGEQEGWTSPFILSCAVIALLGFLGFILAEINTRERIMDLGLFRIGAFSSSMVMTLARSVVLFGSTFLLPLFIQNMMGYDEIVSGLILLPSTLLMMALMPLVGMIGDKIPPRYPALIGIFFLIVSLFMYRNIDLTTSIANVIIPTLFRSVGMLLLMTPIMTAMMNAVPQKKAGMASSMNSIIQQVGGSIGIAIFGTLQANRSNFHLAVVGEQARATTQAFHQSATALMHAAHAQGLSYAQSAAVAQTAIVTKMSFAAVVMSFQDAFLIGSLLLVFVLPIAFMLPAKPITGIREHSLKDEKMKEIVILEG